MKWSDYVEFTKSTAVYPGAGEASITEFAYVALGLAGELGKYHAVSDLQKEADELGEAFWYLARAELMLEAVGHPMRDLYEVISPQLPAVHPALLIGNETKKLMRDPRKNHEDRYKRLSNLYSWCLCELRWIAENRLPGEKDADPIGTILKRNKEKLQRRKDVKSLHGSGDNR